MGCARWARFLFFLSAALFSGRAVATAPAPGASAVPARGPAAAFTPVATPPIRDEGGECTIAVLTGRATRDGRPILWKNRDAYSGDRADQEVIYLADGSIPALALVNAGETRKAWIGVNASGFAILNSVSYNLPDSVTGGVSNGVLMREALQSCVTVGDFENLLRQSNTAGRGSPANFAAIDAAGGAVIFEAGSRSFSRFDVNDPAVAPAGYLVRTNFSVSADTSLSRTSYGKFRYHRCDDLVGARVAGGGLEVQDLLQHVARDIRSADNDPYPLPFAGAPPDEPTALGHIDALATINRRETIAAGAVIGVLPGEDPRLTTFLPIVGHPIVTPVLPAWVAAGPTPPELHGPDGSTLCTLAQARVASLFDDSWRPTLLDTRLLVKPAEGNGYLQQVERIESWLYPEINAALDRWRRDGFTPADLASFEDETAANVLAAYRAGTLAAATGLALIATPNPTSGPVLFRYRAPLNPPAGFAIRIHDAAGRVVAEAERRGAGDPQTGVIAWNGRDAAGRPVPAGVYFYRLDWPGGAPAGVTGGKIVVVR